MSNNMAGLASGLLAVCFFLVFPLAGIAFGYLFYSILKLVTPSLDNVALETSLLGWGLFGLYGGGVGAVNHWRMRRAYHKTHRKQRNG